MQTSSGPVFLKSFCTPEEMADLTLKDTFAEYAHYNPIIAKKESLIALSREPDANVTLAFLENHAIIGLGVLRYAAEEDRWFQVGPRTMMEVAAIEVSRGWRSHGISSEILRLLVDHPLESKRILFMVGYSWTWDLEGTGLNPMDYRRMMVQLFSRQGFEQFQTNEPNVMMHPENLFMARIGRDVPDTVRDRFKKMRFDLL